MNVCPLFELTSTQNILCLMIKRNTLSFANDSKKKKFLKFRKFPKFQKFLQFCMFRNEESKLKAKKKNQRKCHKFPKSKEIDI